jgi:hypothetical protein
MQDQIRGPECLARVAVPINDNGALLDENALDKIVGLHDGMDFIEPQQRERQHVILRALMSRFVPVICPVCPVMSPLLMPE